MEFPLSLLGQGRRLRRVLLKHCRNSRLQLRRRPSRRLPLLWRRELFSGQQVLRYVSVDKVKSKGQCVGAPSPRRDRGNYTVRSLTSTVLPDNILREGYIHGSAVPNTLQIGFRLIDRILSRKPPPGKQVTMSEQLKSSRLPAPTPKPRMIAEARNNLPRTSLLPTLSPSALRRDGFFFPFGMRC